MSRSDRSTAARLVDRDHTSNRRDDGFPGDRHFGYVSATMPPTGRRLATAWPSIFVFALGLSGGVSDAAGAPGAFATNQRIVYSDGLHSENTEMIRVHGRIL